MKNNKRISCDGTVFLTRKDRRIHDSQYLFPRKKLRRINMWTSKPTRRAQSVKLEGDKL